MRKINPKMAKLNRNIVFLYALALLCSMAGMEIFGGLLALLGIGQYLQRRPKGCVALNAPLIGLLLFLVISLISALLNQAQPSIVLDRLRWIPLFGGVVLALRLTPGLGEMTSQRLRIFLGSLIVVGAYAFLQFWTGWDVVRPDRRIPLAGQFSDGSLLYRSIGFFNMPLTYGYSLGIVALVLLGILLAPKRPKIIEDSRRLACVAVGVLILSLITTYTRGVWIGALAGALVIAALLSRIHLLTIAGGSLLSMVIAAFVSQSFRERILSIFDPTYASNSERMNLWRAYWQMFTEHPWFGWGYGRAREALPDAYEKLGIQDGVLSHAHSNYLEILASTGALGLSTWLMAFFGLAWMTFQLYRQLRAHESQLAGMALGCLGAQVMFHLGGATEVSFYDGEVQHMFLFLVATVTLLHSSALSKNKS